MLVRWARSLNVDRISATVEGSFGEGRAGRFSRSLSFAWRSAESCRQQQLWIMMST
jgi:hypothetical protein